MKKLKVGILGGYRGAEFAKGYNLLDEAEVVAGCDMLIGRHKYLKDAQVPKIYLSYEEMLAKEDLDIVVVASGAPYHPDHVVMALECGCHVQSEVPTSFDLEGCKKIVRAVERTGKKYMMAENYQFMPFFFLWKKWFDSGRFGEAICMEGEYIHDCRFLHYIDLETGECHGYNDRHQYKKSVPSWRSGALYRHSINYITHSLGPILWLLDDRCISVSCMGAGPITEADEGWIDYEIATCKTAKGRVVRVTCAFSLHGGGDKVWYSLYGSKGHIENARNAMGKMVYSFEDENEGKLTSVKQEDLDAHFPEEAKSWGHGGGDYFLFREFVDSIIQDRPPIIDVYRAMDYTLPGVLGAISSDEGGAMKVVPDPRCDFC